MSYQYLERNDSLMKVSVLTSNSIRFDTQSWVAMTAENPLSHECVGGKIGMTTVNVRYELLSKFRTVINYCCV